MNSARRYCCCCYSFAELKTLCGPALNVYRLISNAQGFKYEDNQMTVCLQCCEFLKEVHRFKSECTAADVIFHNNLDIKPLKVELMLEDAIDEKSSSQLDIKTELIKEYNEINQIKVQINELEVDFDAKNFSESHSQLHELYDVKECHREKSQPKRIGKCCRVTKQFGKSNRKTHSTETVLECDSCGFKCKGKPPMIAHQILHSVTKLNDGDKPYICSKCSYKTNILYKLKVHIMRRHSDERPFKCNECNHCAKTSEDLGRHKKVHMSDCDKPYNCTECSFKSTSLYDLKDHIKRKHSEDKSLRCDQCDYCTNIESNLKMHKKNHLNDCDKPYKCTECSFKTITLSQLKDHTSRKHCNDKPFSCDQCNYTARRNRDLTKHKRIHLDDDDNPFKCKECSFKTTTMTLLKKHVARKHSDETPFACNECDFRGKLQSDLTFHKRTHLKDSDNPYKCSECSFKTITMYKLRDHIVRKHVSEKPFACDQCDFRGKLQYDLTFHKRTHLKDSDNPYKCNECSYVTNNLYQLNDHTMRKHSDDKPFSCDQCSYCTKMKKDLNNHKKTHLNDCDKPYKCGECSYRTSTLHYLKVHTMRSHSDERPFSCDQCSYSGKLKRDLTAHKKIHLNSTEKPFQ